MNLDSIRRLSSYRFAGPSSFSDPTPHFHIEPLSEKWLQALAQLKPAWTIELVAVPVPTYVPCNDAVRTSFTADGPINVVDGRASPTETPTLSCSLLKQEGGCTHSEYGKQVRADCPLACGVCVHADGPPPASAPAYDQWLVTLPSTDGQVHLHFAERRRTRRKRVATAADHDPRLAAKYSVRWSNNAGKQVCIDATDVFPLLSRPWGGQY